MYLHKKFELQNNAIWETIIRTNNILIVFAFSIDRDRIQ